MPERKPPEDVFIPGSGMYQKIYHNDGSDGYSLVAKDPANTPKPKSRRRSARRIGGKSRF